ncbi:MAG: hypothetical protein WC047_00240 [Kiritimatiellales bacterium]
MIAGDGTIVGLSQDLAATLQSIAVEQATTREQLKSVFRLLEEQREANKALNTLTLSVLSATDEIKRLRKDVDDMRCKPLPDEITRMQVDMDALKGKPGKRWDMIQTVAITSIVTGVVGFVVAKLLD